MTTKESMPVDAPAPPLSKSRICKYSGCRKKFKPHRQDHVFCKKACRFAHHNYGSAFGTLTKAGVDRLVRIASEALVKDLPKLIRKHMDAENRRAQDRVAKFSVALTGFGEVLIELQRRITALEKARAEKADTPESVARKATLARRAVAALVSDLNSPAASRWP